MTTYSAILSKPDNKDKKKKTSIFGKPKQSLSDDDSESSGTWLGFFFKLFLFAGVCAGGYYGYLEYQRRQAYVGGGNFGGMGRGGSGGFGGGMYQNSKRY